MSLIGKGVLVIVAILDSSRHSSINESTHIHIYICLVAGRTNTKPSCCRCRLINCYCVKMLMAAVAVCVVERENIATQFFKNSMRCVALRFFLYHLCWFSFFYYFSLFRKHAALSLFYFITQFCDQLTERDFFVRFFVFIFPLKQHKQHTESICVLVFWRCVGWCIAFFTFLNVILSFFFLLCFSLLPVFNAIFALDIKRLLVSISCLLVYPVPFFSFLFLLFAFLTLTLYDFSHIL